MVHLAIPLESVVEDGLKQLRDDSRHLKILVQIRPPQREEQVEVRPSARQEEVQGIDEV